MRIPGPALLCAAFLAAAAALLAACTPDPAPRPGPAPGAAADGPLASSLQVETFPDSVRFSLQVTNVSGAPVRVTFPTGQSFDFRVAREGGAELWRWSADRGFTQAVREETWPAGETRTFSASWRPAAGTTGRLVATGLLTSVDRRVERTASFSLP